MDQRPIGIFDSGIGGLTLAHEIKKILPNERIIYFGDTAHLPYGDKSPTSIQAYSIKICNVLLQQNCKHIVIACNSASSAAYELVKTYVGSKAEVTSVIDPIVDYVGEKYEGKTVGVLGTKQTIFSNIYKSKIDLLSKKIDVRSLATPLLAPMIEEGFFGNTISGSIIKEYLKDPVLEGIDALVLGCTHYPLIKKEIDAFYEGKIEVIDYSVKVAAYIKESLTTQNLLSDQLTDKYHFYVSDFTESFQKSTAIFFGKELNLEQYKIWD